MATAILLHANIINISALVKNMSVVPELVTFLIFFSGVFFFQLSWWKTKSCIYFQTSMPAYLFGKYTFWVEDLGPGAAHTIAWHLVFPLAPEPFKLPPPSFQQLEILMNENILYALRVCIGHCIRSSCGFQGSFVFKNNLSCTLNCYSKP